MSGKIQKSQKSNPLDRADCCVYECNICLSTAKSPVVTYCGHLFCWPCLWQWFQLKSRRPVCPVCKSPINKRQIISIYGRNDGPTTTEQKTTPHVDAGEPKIPARPKPFQSQDSDKQNSLFPDPYLAKLFVCMSVLFVFWCLYA